MINSTFLNCHNFLWFKYIFFAAYQLFTGYLVSKFISLECHNYIFPHFLSIIICFNVFIYQVFLSNKNNLHSIIWF